MPMSKNKKILMMLAKGGADAGDKPALAVAVALVAVGAGILCLGVHVLVDEGLGHRAEQLPHVDHAIVESGHLGRPKLAKYTLRSSPYRESFTSQ